MRFNDLTTAFILTICLLLCGHGRLSAQSLDFLRSEVSDSGARVSQSKKTSRSEHDDCHTSGRSALSGGLDDECDCKSPISMIAAAVLTSPFTVPRMALGDQGDSAAYLDFPYNCGAGSMTFDPTVPQSQDAMADFQFDFGTSFGQLFQTHARMVLDGLWRLGIDTEFYDRFENRSGNKDHLATGDLNVVYRFAQSEKWQFRAGLGINWMLDQGNSAGKGGDQIGFNMTYSADWFPSDPIRCTSAIDAGTLGDAGLFHFRNTIGVTRRGWGAFTGHDYVRIGDFKNHAWINGVEYRY
ncbi:MAG: hypothetical protein KDA91_21995 [Planctomycetaceae bacterium]|nr:hypothetical protein [Planctomycetaceae bacterium]